MEGRSGVNSEYGTDVLLLLGPLPSGRGRVRCYGILIGYEFRNYFMEGHVDVSEMNLINVSIYGVRYNFPIDRETLILIDITNPHGFSPLLIECKGCN